VSINIIVLLKNPIIFILFLCGR